MIGAQLGDADRVITYAGQALSAAWHTKVRSTAGATECGDRTGHTPILSYALLRSSDAAPTPDETESVLRWGGRMSSASHAHTGVICAVRSDVRSRGVRPGETTGHRRCRSG
jgi:hypothetical protein